MKASPILGSLGGWHPAIRRGGTSEPWKLLVVLQRNTRWNWTKKMEWATTILPTIFRDADCSLFFAFPRWLLPAFTRKEWTTLQLDRSIFFIWGSFANWNSPRWSQYGWPLWHVKSTCCIVPKQSRWLALLVSYDCASPGGCHERMEAGFPEAKNTATTTGEGQKESLFYLKGFKSFTRYEQRIRWFFGDSPECQRSL